MIRSLKRRRRRSSVCISIRRKTPRFSAWMRRVRLKLWIGGSPFAPFPRPCRTARVEYHRHGTLSLYAALNPQTGAVIGQTAARHTSQEFVAFLADVVATQPAEREIHVILDNFSTHKTELVKDYLRQHPNVPCPSLRLTLRGSIRSRAGLAAFSATSSIAASSLPSAISNGRSFDMFASIRKPPNPSSGNIMIPPKESPASHSSGTAHQFQRGVAGISR